MCIICLNVKIHLSCRTNAILRHTNYNFFIIPFEPLLCGGYFTFVSPSASLVSSSLCLPLPLRRSPIRGSSGHPTPDLSSGCLPIEASVLFVNNTHLLVTVFSAVFLHPLFIQALPVSSYFQRPSSFGGFSFQLSSFTLHPLLTKLQH